MWQAVGMVIFAFGKSSKGKSNPPIQKGGETGQHRSKAEFLSSGQSLGGGSVLFTRSPLMGPRRQEHRERGRGDSMWFWAQGKSCGHMQIQAPQASTLLRTTLHPSATSISFRDFYVHSPASWRFFALLILVKVERGSPGGASGNELACQCRKHKRHGFNPWVAKTPWRRAWKPTPVFLPGESQGARWITVHGVTQSWKWLKQLSKQRKKGKWKDHQKN